MLLCFTTLRAIFHILPHHPTRNPSPHHSQTNLLPLNGCISHSIPSNINLARISQNPRHSEIGNQAGERSNYMYGRTTVVHEYKQLIKKDHKFRCGKSYNKQYKMYLYNIHCMYVRSEGYVLHMYFFTIDNFTICQLYRTTPLPPLLLTLIPRPHHFHLRFSCIKNSRLAPGAANLQFWREREINK